MAEVVRGYLIVHVEEATGKAKDDGRFTWDTQGRFDGFTKSKMPVRRAHWLRAHSLTAVLPARS